MKWIRIKKKTNYLRKYFTGWRWLLKFYTFYKYSVWEKQRLSLLNIFKNLQEINKKDYTPRTCWAFKSELHIILAATYIALFLLDSNKCFFTCIIPYVHICTISPFYVFTFTFSYSLFLSWNTFYSLQCFIQFYRKLSITLQR